MNLDEEHIMLAKLGDSRAISELMSKYKPLVKNISRKYFLVGGDTEDLMQEGMIGLYDAILSYDRKKNDHFDRYAYLIIERNILNAIKRANALKFSPLNDGTPLNHQGEVENEEGNYPFAMEIETPEEHFLRQERNQQFEEAIATQLSSLEKNIVEEYLKGRSYAEIAKILSISPKSVDNALSRIKTKLSYLKEKE